VDKSLIHMLQEDELNKIATAAFNDELVEIEKQSGFLGNMFGKLHGEPVSAIRSLTLPGRLGGTMAEEAAKAVTQVRHPLEGLSHGWNVSMTPSRNTEKLQEIAHGIQGNLGKLPTKSHTTWYGKTSDNPLSLKEMGDSGHSLMSYPELIAQNRLKNQAPAEGILNKIKNIKARATDESHLLEHPAGRSLVDIARGKNLAPGEGRLRAGAEELSRRGWTGEGAATKYLPLGPKGQFAAFTAMDAPGVVDAYNKGDVGPTGEGGLGEKGLGALGGAGGWVLGAPLGLLGGAGMWLGGQQLGKSVGRIVDRMRGGANLPNAMFAPSETEAQSQLENIQRYYTPQPQQEQYPTKGTVNV
jgi:hypothetical protein